MKPSKPLVRVLLHSLHANQTELSSRFHGHLRSLIRNIQKQRTFQISTQRGKILNAACRSLSKRSMQYKQTKFETRSLIERSRKEPRNSAKARMAMHPFWAIHLSTSRSKRTPTRSIHQIVLLKTNIASIYGTLGRIRKNAKNHSI